MPDSLSASLSSDAVRDFLLDGLRNAHAMESQAISLTKGQADRLENYPQLRARLLQHCEETERQRERVDACLNAMGSDNSTLKDLALKFGANMQMLIHGAASDEVVKNSLASFAFENFEIAAYKSLIAAADAVGERQIVDICRQNLDEEVTMARWLDEHLSEVTLTYIARSSQHLKADR